MSNQVRKADVADIEFLDAEELQSTGTSAYLTTTVVSTTSNTRTVVIELPSDGQGILLGEDHPAQAGDYVVITGTAGGLGDGTFTVESVATDTRFVVLESIGASTGGSVDFRYPSGASRIGVDPTNLAFTSGTSVQEVLEAIQVLPAATQVGDLLASRNGSTFSVVHPVVSADDGWLSNSDSDLLVEGLDS